MTAKKILVADDSPADLSNLVSILSDMGFNVLTANNGRDAISLAKSEKPDLIFMDIVMEHMDGYEAARTLSNDSVTESIPLIFVSNKKQKADRVWAKMQGAKELISKPYTADQITDNIKTHS